LRADYFSIPAEEIKLLESVLTQMDDESGEVHSNSQNSRLSPFDRQVLTGRQ
jgi:hypothetical protein